MASNIFERVYHKTIRIVAGICTTAIFGLNTLPHFFPQKVLQATKQTSCNSYDIKEEHKKILQETCELMNIDSDKVSIFYTNGFSTHSAGSFNFPNKAIIGLPRNAAFNSPGDIMQTNIIFQDKPIDWSSNTGKALLDVLIFQEKEIKFLIGHELTHIKNKDFIVTTAHATGCFYGFYKAGVYFPSLWDRPLSRKVLMSVIIWLVGLSVYMSTKEWISHNFEYRADEESARLQVDYCCGGIEYMRNRLKLNRIIRKLHGETGEKLFSKVGNNLQDSATHPKRTARLHKLKEIKSDYPSQNRTS